MNTFLPGRLARRLGLVLGVVVAVGSLMAFTSSLELGERPPSSLQSVTPAPDVKFIEANGLRFAYLEEGTGPLVLMMHGYPETARSWNAVRRRVAKAGYRVVTPYSRGRPPSSIPSDGNYALSALGEDLIALIDAFGERQAVVVGHDWGASAGYAAATARPEKISHLVAIGVPHARAIVGDKSFFLDAPHFVYYQFPWAERLVWSHDFAHLERVYQRGAPDWQAPPEVLAEAKATMRVPGAVEAAIGYYRAVFKGNTRNPRLVQKPISVPTLVIAGKADGNFLLPRFEAARAAFSGRYRLLAMDGVGHFPHLEASEATAEAILDFLRKELP